MYALGKQRLASGAKAMASALAAVCVAVCAALFVALGLGGCTPVPNTEPTSTASTGLPTATPPLPGESGPPGGPAESKPGAGPVPTVRPPASSRPTSTVFELARRAKEILEACVRGELTFRPPSPMRQGETREFVLHVTLGDPGAGHEKNIPGPNPVQTREPIVCEEMRADLSGPDMTIERAGNPGGEMLVPEQGVAEWRWWITPKDPGRKTMTLQLFATAEDGPDLSLETFREDIQVEIELGYVLSSLVKDWAQPLGVTIPVLVAAIGTMLVWSRSKHGKAKHAANTKPADPPGGERNTPPRRYIGSMAHAADQDLGPDVRLQARVEGVVQAVGFRYWTVRKAEELSLTGTVRNDVDGTVAVVVEGPQAMVLEFRRWLRSSDAPGRVDHVEESVSPATGEFSNFDVVY
jgi:acylphosphatase